MDEKIIIMKTRDILPFIEKLVELENLGGSKNFLNSKEFESFEKFLNDRIISLKKPVKYVFRSR